MSFLLVFAFLVTFLLLNNTNTLWKFLTALHLGGVRATDFLVSFSMEMGRHQRSKKKKKKKHERETNLFKIIKRTVFLIHAP